VIAILDWELSTLGHRMSDVASLTVSHHITSSPTSNTSPPTKNLPVPLLNGFGGLNLAELGIPSAQKLLQLYAERSQLPADVVRCFHFYVAFMFFKVRTVSQRSAHTSSRVFLTNEQYCFDCCKLVIT
jgi:aminoglycoside phosphotransferase (APT) family kinase protein